jgi:hypothetical protein
MSKLLEIEAAAAALPPEELEALEKRLHELNVARRGGKVFTAIDAARWWRERTAMSRDEAAMSRDEAASFADDVEAGRAEMNRPPPPSPWA